MTIHSMIEYETNKLFLLKCGMSIHLPNGFFTCGLRLALLLAITACTVAPPDPPTAGEIRLCLVETPGTRPAFIKELLAGGSRIGIVIDEFALWQAGDTALDLHQEIQNNLRLAINGRTLPTEELEFFSRLSLTGVLSNDQSEILGSYSDLTVYIDLSDYSVGQYTATVSIERLGDALLSYTWAFTIEEISIESQASPEPC
ncbi:MAG: hypothetical protein JNM70_17325 [Anaerolineae bacterium]|nr:hypothetical protein [Anaerolineae bacterium]